VDAKTGKPLSFELLLSSGGNDQWVLPFKHNLERLGITMNIRQVDNAQITNRMRSRDYDMMQRLWPAAVAKLGPANLLGLQLHRLLLQCAGRKKPGD
jgi:ABC-type oligopeptide transport system substrate-binding subunit